jgi:MFS family permease
MISITMLFRYADFIVFLGGSEWHLGWIVGVGMVGSLAVRLAMGQTIDRYGSRLIWLGSVVLLAIVCFAHVGVTTHGGVAIYLLRLAFSCAVAGIFGASMTFVSSQVSVIRLAEMWGMLGTAGFLGTMVGPLISDWMLGAGAVTRSGLNGMFLVADYSAAVRPCLRTWRLAVSCHGPDESSRRFCIFCGAIIQAVSCLLVS